MTQLFPPQMTCPRCSGYGLVTGYGGEPTDCTDCICGSVDARDEKGRFLPWVPLKDVYADHS